LNGKENNLDDLLNDYSGFQYLVLDTYTETYILSSFKAILPGYVNILPFGHQDV
jgi:hypothetical protein